MYRQCIFSNKIAVKVIDWYDVNCIITHPADSRQCIRILLTPDHQYIPFWDIWVSLIRPYSCNTRILPYPAVSCRILSYPAVSCRILPYPAVSCRILPYPAVSCRICRILPYPAVSCRILPYASNRNPNPNPNLNPNCNPNLEFQLLVKVS